MDNFATNKQYEEAHGIDDKTLAEIGNILRAIGRRNLARLAAEQAAKPPADPAPAQADEEVAP